MHPGVMADSPAIIISDGDEKRKGRVVLISPHPEDGEPWTKGHFRNLFRWAGNRCPGEILPKKELTLEKQKMILALYLSDQTLGRVFLIILEKNSQTDFLWKVYRRLIL